MKTAAADPVLPELAAAGPAAIVHLADTAHELPPDQVVGRARAFAEPLLTAQWLDTGEPTLEHADGVAALLRAIGGAPSLCAAAYLVYAGDHLQRPEEVVRKGFGESFASLVMLTRQLVQVQRAARRAQQQPATAARTPERRAEQVERVRKMLLAFSRDLRVVLLRLASRLQTLRWHAASRTACPAALAQESREVFAPLANRLGIWQFKWELEDLSFRFLEPEEYHRIARLVDQTRTARESSVALARAQLAAQLAAAGVQADVQGRPKHLYSIWRKMQGKQLDFERVLDVRALRVIVADTAACYAALAQVHALWTAIDGEFDDYVARPKPNGYQSLHTVVRDAERRPLEVQIRTRAMHEHAEHGVAAHWMYKEAGVRGYAGVAAAGEFEDRVAEARKAVLRELLAWERDLSSLPAPGPQGGGTAPFDDRIYVFTPQARIIELPAGGTALDFAYALHTELGHRCRGARVDGALVPLNTALRNGQTVDVVAAREGGPSRDWLQPGAGYLQSPRARAKVRAWFNAEQQQATIARGRELVEKLLQREGRTALKLGALAEQLGFDDADALFAVVGKDEYSLRHIEQLLRPPESAPAEDPVALRRPRTEPASGRGGVLVVGVDSLLTTLARCCRPAPPDPIAGFVTRGKGVAIHRADCDNLRHMVERSPGRLIQVAWGREDGSRGATYPLDIAVEASDRPGLLRDISDLLAKEKLHVTAVQSARRGQGGAGAARRSGAEGRTWMTFTVETDDATRLPAVLGRLAAIPGVRHARRR